MEPEKTFSLTVSFAVAAASAALPLGVPRYAYPVPPVPPSAFAAIAFAY